MGGIKSASTHILKLRRNYWAYVNSTLLNDEDKAASPPHATSTHGTAAHPSFLLTITNVVDCCDLNCCHPSSWPTTTIIIGISILHLLASSFAPLLPCVPPPPSPLFHCGHRCRHRIRLPSTSAVFCLICVCCQSCKTSIRGCNKLLLCITVKLVHKIMRAFYSHCFAFRYACDTQCVAGGGMFCHMWTVCQKRHEKWWLYMGIPYSQ